jgi:hypothetical protein
VKGGDVGQAVLLLAHENPAEDGGPRIPEKLVELGVTSVSVLRDDRTTAVVLEGWLFDPDRLAELAARLVAPDPSAVRILRPVAESLLHASSAISTATTERRHA